MKTARELTNAAGRDAAPTASITIKWSMVAFSCGMIAIASLGTLIVVTAVKDIDTLSTVALVLAILAFVIQIIIFIAQSWTSGQQMLQSETVNADTRALLAELRENMRSTHALLGQHYDKVLERLLVVTDRTVKETVKDADVDTLRERLHAELSEVIRTEIGGIRPEPYFPSHVPLQRQLFTDRNRQDAVEMRTMPEDEEGMRRAVEELASMPPVALGSLYRLGLDILESRETGGYVGLNRRTIRELDLLETQALIGPIDDYDAQLAPQDADLVGLSPKGRYIARLLLSADDGPPQLEPQITSLRKVARSEADKARREIRSRRTRRLHRAEQGLPNE